MSDDPVTASRLLQLRTAVVTPTQFGALFPCGHFHQEVPVACAPTAPPAWMLVPWEDGYALWTLCELPDCDLHYSRCISLGDPAPLRIADEAGGGRPVYLYQIHTDTWRKVQP